MNREEFTFIYKRACEYARLTLPMEFRKAYGVDLKTYKRRRADIRDGYYRGYRDGSNRERTELCTALIAQEHELGGKLDTLRHRVTKALELLESIGMFTDDHCNEVMMRGHEEYFIQALDVLSLVVHGKTVSERVTESLEAGNE